MDLIKFNANISEKIYHIMADVAFLEYFFKNIWKYASIIKKNRVLQDIATDDKCYILGNGPSIKNLDLSLLYGKNVITVNRMIDTELFDRLNPVAHVIIDYECVIKGNEDNIKKCIESHPNTAFVLHRKAIDNISGYDNVFFVYSRITPFCGGIYIDMTKPITGFINVVPQAIITAMYMGYKKIALLGHDFSFFTKPKEAHFYSSDKKENRQVPMYQDLEGGAITCLQYRWLYRYCLQKGYRVVNTTEGSFMDEVPFESLDDFINETN